MMYLVRICRLDFRHPRAFESLRRIVVREAETPNQAIKQVKDWMRERPGYELLLDDRFTYLPEVIERGFSPEAVMDMDV